MLDIAMNGTKHLVLDRRKFLSVAAGLIAAGVIPKSALALAAPYAFKQGAYDITVVSDGTLLLPLSVVSPEAKPEDLKVLLGAAMAALAMVVLLFVGASGDKSSPSKANARLL